MDAQKKQGTSTKELKQVLSFTDLMGTAVGQIIGAGIMTLMGIAIAITGKGVPFAFLISAILVICASIPYVIICSTVRVRGGNYTMVSMLAGKRLAGAYIILYIFANISIAMYALAFADYFASLFGMTHTKIIALIVLTFVYILNFMGIDKMAKFQNIIVLLMCIALGLFAVMGIPKIQPGYFDGKVLLHGVSGLLQAGGLLTFATGGASNIANLSAEAKNPTRDIPLAIIVSTFTVAILYGVIAFVAAGVLPIEEVAGQNLSKVAAVVLSKPLYIFFMVCGAMFALLSTLNAQLGWCSKPIMQACDDGWLPKKLAYVHPKYKTPVIILTIFYAIGVICIVSGLSIRILGNLCVVATQLAALAICIFTYRLPKIAPNGWEHSKFKTSQGMLIFYVCLATAAAVFNIYLNASQLTKPLLIGNFLVLIGAIIYSQLRYKHTTFDVSYEEIDA